MQKDLLYKLDKNKLKIVVFQYNKISNR
jgi:hypothetical protein